MVSINLIYRYTILRLVEKQVNKYHHESYYMSRPTITTVSKQAGVSVSTVSQVLRGSGRISQQTRDKVLKAVKAVNYVRDSRAAAMRSGQFREVGLLIHDISNPFNAEVLAGVTHLLEQHDYLVYVLDARDDVTRQRRYLEMLVGHARGGLIWVPAQHTTCLLYTSPSPRDS